MIHHKIKMRVRFFLGHPLALNDTSQSKDRANAYVADRDHDLADWIWNLEEVWNFLEAEVGIIDAEVVLVGTEIAQTHAKVDSDYIDNVEADS